MKNILFKIHETLKDNYGIWNIHRGAANVSTRGILSQTLVSGFHISEQEVLNNISRRLITSTILRQVSIKINNGIN